MYVYMYVYVLIGYTGYAFTRILLILILNDETIIKILINTDSYNTPQTHVTIH